METSELLHKVRQIEIKTRGLSQHLFAGEYHSVFKGRGMSFSEVRAYQYGDDIRNIDWNVTARANEPFVKQFEEERELTTIILADISGSSQFGTQAQNRSEVLTEIAATLSFSAIQNNDKVGVIFFSDKIEAYMPPKKGRTHILRVIRELLEIQPAGHGTDLRVAMDFLNNVQKKRCTVFLLSDFLCGTSYEPALRVAARRHDLIGMRLFDGFEANLPDIGLLRVKDAETGQLHWLDTSSMEQRTAHQNWYQNHVQNFEQTFLRAGAETIHFNLRDSYAEVLQRFFVKRMKRR